MTRNKKVVFVVSAVLMALAVIIGHQPDTSYPYNQFVECGNILGEVTYNRHHVKVTPMGTSLLVEGKDDQGKMITDFIKIPVNYGKRNGGCKVGKD